MYTKVQNRKNTSVVMKYEKLFLIHSLSKGPKF